LVVFARFEGPLAFFLLDDMAIGVPSPSPSIGVAVPEGFALMSSK
jgi:hypothetical protein